MSILSAHLIISKLFSLSQGTICSKKFRHWSNRKLRNLQRRWSWTVRNSKSTKWSSKVTSWTNSLISWKIQLAKTESNLVKDKCSYCQHAKSRQSKLYLPVQWANSRWSLGWWTSGPRNLKNRSSLMSLWHPARRMALTRQSSLCRRMRPKYSPPAEKSKFNLCLWMRKLVPNGSKIVAQ